MIRTMTHPRITADPAVMLGKPCIKGTRITVELILRWLSEGRTFAELLEAYPHLGEDDIKAALLTRPTVEKGQRPPSRNGVPLPTKTSRAQSSSGSGSTVSLFTRLQRKALAPPMPMYWQPPTKMD